MLSMFKDPSFSSQPEPETKIEKVSDTNTMYSLLDFELSHGYDESVILRLIKIRMCLCIIKNRNLAPICV
jgi:hypothetical protein